MVAVVNEVVEALIKYGAHLVGVWSSINGVPQEIRILELFLNQSFNVGR